MESKALNAADSTAPNDTQYELGLWLGRHQAFALVANRCSAADAHALRVIRDQNLYRQRGLNWEQFCKLHAGCSYKTADRIIDRLREFGDTYFNLSQIVNIPVPEYRALQPAIHENAIEFDGRRIEINRENTEELIGVVKTLRARLQKTGDAAPRDPLAAIESQLDRTIGALSGAMRRSEGIHRQMLTLMIEDFGNRVVELQRQLGEVIVLSVPEEDAA
jgi:hypothetical protein